MVLSDNHFSSGSGETLYAVIANATLSEDNTLLNFRRNNFELIPYMYIHPSWLILYERIMHNLGVHEKNHILITGSPGVGKSQFKYYCMWCTISSENCPSFIFQSQPNAAVLYSASSDSDISNPRKGPEDLPFFVDILEQAGPNIYLVQISAYTIVFSSPDNSRFKEFMKHRDSIKYILEPWSEEEVYKAWIPSFNKVPKEKVASQYAIYGGVPRYLFNHSDQFYVPMKFALGTNGSYD